MTTFDSELIDCEIPATCSGMRFDQALAELIPDLSRSRLQHWIRSGCIRLNGQVVRPRARIFGGEKVSGTRPKEALTTAKAQSIALDIVFADSDILIVDKPAGLVVHPAAGNLDGTLLNALLHHVPELAQLPRAGLVHRLDKDTSGLLVVARTPRAHASLVAQLQARSMGREYQAVVSGVMVAGGRVEAPIGRHPVDRKRMAVIVAGKPAVTHYRVISRFRDHTHLRVCLETGRTHQIRVHLAHLRFPLVGDPVYGGRMRFPAQASKGCLEVLRGFQRQALHAAQLTLTHPASGERLTWKSPLPTDMQRLLSALHQDLECADE